MIGSGGVRRLVRRALAGGVSVLALATGSAVAQDRSAVEVDEVVVTATKRASTVQDVPFSINAQTQEDIQRSGSTNVEELSRNVAGLTVQNLGPGQSQVAVRGVSAGQIVRDQPGVKEQVGVYLDESVVSLSLFTPDLDLFDLNRVETLRGPQGTLFGSGSVGGTIRYITNQPSTSGTAGMIEANLNVVDGDDVGGWLKGAFNQPLSDQAAVRLVAYHTEYGGFIDARREGGRVDKNVNSGSRTGGRIAFLYEPTEQIRLTPRVVYQQVRADGFNREEVFNLYANPNTTTRPPIRLGEREQHLLLNEAFEDDTLIADFTGEIDFGSLALTSVTTYIDRDILVSRDASALTGSVSVDLGFPSAGVLLPSNLRDTTALETFTQEVRLASTGEGPFQWLVGVFFSDVDRAYAQRLPTPGYDAFTDARFGAGTSAAVANGFPLQSPYNADIRYDIKQKAVFGEASYTWDRLTGTAGLRYYDFEEERTFKSGGLFSNGDDDRDRTESDGFTPRFLLSYEIDPDFTLNAQASKGFRLGGVNDPLNLPLCSGGATGPDAATFGNRPRYEDETLWNYEAGMKLRRGRTTFNAAAFYTDIKNLQVTADAGSCSSRVVFNTDAHTSGVEIELATSPIAGLELAINASAVEAKFDQDLRNANGDVIAGIRDGNRLPSVPEFQLSAVATYVWQTDWLGGSDAFVNAAFQHVGTRFTQPGDQEQNPRSFVSGLAFGGASGTQATVLDLELPDYQLVNLSTGLETAGGLDLVLYVTNVFDENPRMSFDRERGGRARLGFNVGQPRTVGVTLRKSF
jgi:iron complex outermembrane receptor protein